MTELDRRCEEYFDSLGLLDRQELEEKYLEEVEPGMRDIEQYNLRDKTDCQIKQMLADLKFCELYDKERKTW